MAALNTTAANMLTTLSMQNRYQLGYGHGFNKGFQAGLAATDLLATIVLASFIIQTFLDNILRNDGHFQLTAFNHTVVDVEIGHRKTLQIMDAALFAVQMLGIALIFVVTVWGVPVVEVTMHG